MPFAAVAECFVHCWDVVVGRLSVEPNEVCVIDEELPYIHSYVGTPFAKLCDQNKCCYSSKRRLIVKSPFWGAELKPKVVAKFQGPF